MKKIFWISVFGVLLLNLIPVYSMPPLEGVSSKGVWPKFPEGVNQPNPHRLGKSPKGTWNALVILIDFSDYPWDFQGDTLFPNSDTLYTKAHFDSMLFSLGTYKDPNSASSYTGSMRDYYQENSYGQFDVGGVITVWYTAPDTFNFYCNTDGIPGTDDDYGFGSYPNNVQRLVEDAIAAADPDVDFSQFDNDKDGWVDALFVVHAGPGAEAIPYPEGCNYIWSHAWGISSQQRDGVWISGYSMEPENGTIGVFCHEFGHVLGLPDLYDTDRSSEGVGEWCLMGGVGWCYRSLDDDYGTCPSHFSAWCKAQLGWFTPTNVDTNLFSVTIPAVEANPVAYRLWTDGAYGKEYFLVENRQNLGFDLGLTRRQKDYGLPDAYGLVIWHIDESVWDNDNELHKMVDVEEASPLLFDSTVYEHLDHRRIRPTDRYLYNGNRGDNGDPWPGFSSFNSDSSDFAGSRDVVSFNEYSHPNSNSYSLTPTNVAVENIQCDCLNVIADLLVTPIVGVEEDGSKSRERSWELRQNWPNPFNSSTNIEYVVRNQETKVQLRVYNLAGELVRELVNGAEKTGFHRVTWDGRDNRGKMVANGVYFYRLNSSSNRVTKRMIIMR